MRWTTEHWLTPVIIERTRGRSCSLPPFHKPAPTGPLPPAGHGCLEVKGRPWLRTLVPCKEQGRREWTGPRRQGWGLSCTSGTRKPAVPHPQTEPAHWWACYQRVLATCKDGKGSFPASSAWRNQKEAGLGLRNKGVAMVTPEETNLSRRGKGVGSMLVPKPGHRQGWLPRRCLQVPWPTWPKSGAEF